MTRESGGWQSRVLARFSDREDLGRNGAYDQFWSDLPKGMAMELMALVESEYGVPGGLLRPTDSIKLLAVPIRTKNPIMWAINEIRAGDSALEMGQRLAKQMDRLGTRSYWPKIRTIDDLFRAWCGERPRDESSD